MEKNEIREKIKVLRQDQPAKLRAKRTKKITYRTAELRELSIEQVRDKRIAIFHSFAGEPDMKELYDILTRRGAKLFFPVICDSFLYMAEVDNGYDDPKTFHNGTLGIKEPDLVSDKFIPMDIIIIPGVAFSAQGDRIGFGKGYYDKYLAQYGPNDLPVLIAPIFEFQIINEIFTDELDVPVDIIVTENECIRTGIRHK